MAALEINAQCCHRELGDLLNSLFGTATESDLDGIRNQL